MNGRRQAALRGRWIGVAVCLAAVLLAGSGCSRQKLLVYSTVPLIDAALAETFSSADIETARQGIPGQILLLRGLCRSDPGNTDVWTTTVQLYASYALIFVGDEDPGYATELYREGRELGSRFLRRIDWFAEAWDAGPDALRRRIAAEQPRDLAPLLLWTGACLGQYVLANLDRPREMLDLPYVFVLLEAAIDLEPSYFYGMPYAVMGMTLATIPQGLGGNLEQSRRYFEQAFAVAGEDFLLHRVFYARYHNVMALDEAEFTATLEDVLVHDPRAMPAVRFINTVSQQRARELLEQRYELF